MVAERQAVPGTGASPLWPRRQSAATALVALLLCQAGIFFAVTQGTFFVGDDFAHFLLAQERDLLHYLATPILHVYPAPGHRLVTYLFQEISPLNHVAARVFFLILLAATTMILGQFVRTLARSDKWWTVTLLTPFALSATLVSAVWWWSNGVVVMPALFFTAVAISAWLKSYTEPRRTAWVGVTVVAIAAAGGFYMKFLLIPLYLLLLRLVVFPPLYALPGGIRSLWDERGRWIAVATPPALFVAAFVLSGLAGRSAVPGERPFLQYFALAWSHGLIPVSVLNAELQELVPATSFWIALTSQVLFWVVLGATWKRSALALRGWALFVVAFVANMAMIGTVRLPGFGVEIAYWLRYYPEVVFFLPVALALAFRQGSERRPQVAWEKTSMGQVALGVSACLYVVFLAIWGPWTVARSEGAPAGAWFGNLQQDIHAVTADEPVLRLVDSETPEYVMASWMAPRNRVSAVLGLTDLDVVYNQWSDSTYLVMDDGRLAQARFRPILQLLSGTDRDEAVHTGGEHPSSPDATCLGDAGTLNYVPEAHVTGERLAVRALYAGEGQQPVALEVDTADPERPLRRLQLRPQNGAEVVDLATSRVRALQVQAASDDGVCIRRLEIGSLTGGPYTAAFRS